MRPHRDDIFAGGASPSCTGPLEAKAEETLAGRLDIPASDRKPEFACRHVVHQVALVLEVRDRIVNWTAVADEDVLLPGGAKVGKDRGSGGLARAKTASPIGD